MKGGKRGGKHGAVDRASDSEYMSDWPACMGSSPTGAKNLCELLVPLNKALYSNCSVVRRSRKAVGPVYMYLNSNTLVTKVLLLPLVGGVPRDPT